MGGAAVSAERARECVALGESERQTEREMDLLSRMPSIDSGEDAAERAGDRDGERGKDRDAQVTDYQHDDHTLTYQHFLLAQEMQAPKTPERSSTSVQPPNTSDPIPPTEPLLNPKR